MAPPNRAGSVPAREAALDGAVVSLGREGGVYADQFEIYHGNSNPDLARKICRYLGVEPGKAEVFQFANENIFVKILDNVREKDVFLVQPTCHPVNQSIMELLIMIDALKRASAESVTVVMPYFSYAKGDKKDEPRVSIRARVCADAIESAGAYNHQPEFAAATITPDGDKAILESTHATPIDLSDPKQRALDNVVEEMAIAGGLPKPAVYVIPDRDPNAFATGRGPEKSSIAVTTRVTTPICSSATTDRLSSHAMGCFR